MCASKQPNSGEYTNKHTASKKRSIIIDTMPFGVVSLQSICKGIFMREILAISFWLEIACGMF